MYSIKQHRGQIPIEINRSKEAVLLVKNVSVLVSYNPLSSICDWLKLPVTGAGVGSVGVGVGGTGVGPASVSGKDKAIQ